MENAKTVGDCPGGSFVLSSKWWRDKFRWWRDKDNREAASALTSFLQVAIPAAVIVLGAAAAWIGLSPAPTVHDKPPAVEVAGNGNFTQTGGTSFIGYTIEQHEQALKEREAQLRADLGRASFAEKALLQQQLDAISGQLRDLKESYAQTLKDLHVDFHPEVTQLGS